jgi:ribonuclease HI
MVTAHLRLARKVESEWSGLPTGCGAVVRGHILYARSLLGRFDLPDLDRADAITPFRPASKRYTVRKESFETGRPLRRAGMHAYTDGSKFPKSIAGSGVAIFNSAQESFLESHFSLESHTSVYMAEVAAITQAAHLALDMVETWTEKKTVFIYSDNQAALRALASGNITSASLLACHQALDLLGASFLVEHRWVRAHVGHPGNERADVLAKRAVTQPRVLRTSFVPKCEFKRLIKAWVDRAWTDMWPSYHLSQTYIWFPTPNRPLAKALLKYSRGAFTRMVGFITGHCWLCRQNILVNPNYGLSTLCRKCFQAPERACHILLDCEPLWRIRQRHFLVPFLPPTPLWHPHQLHGFLTEPSIVQLLIPE